MRTNCKWKKLIKHIFQCFQDHKIQEDFSFKRLFLIGKQLLVHLIYIHPYSKTSVSLLKCLCFNILHYITKFYMNFLQPMHIKKGGRWHTQADILCIFFFKYGWFPLFTEFIYYRV